MLGFQNSFKYRNSDLQLLNSNIFATLSANSIKIGPVTSEITRITTAPFLDDTATRGPSRG